MFIGKYNKSVIVTYLGVVSMAIGLCLACSNHVTGAVICLIISGVCDLFDGKIARLCKNRTEEDMEFGIQIDSLTDMISFVALPIVISINLGLNEWYYGFIYALFAIGGISRLGYFNLNANAEGPVKYYTGLPVTTTSMIFPILYLIGYFMKYSFVFKMIYLFSFLVIAFLFVFNFKIKKPKNNWWYILCSALAIIGILALLYIKFIR